MDTYNVQKGVLRLGTRILPLPIAESYRLSCRVALAILFDYFEGEPQAERKAFDLHYSVARRISSVVEGWTLSTDDLNEIVIDILCAAKKATTHGEQIKLEYVTGQRRDTLRMLSESCN